MTKQYQVGQLLMALGSIQEGVQVRGKQVEVLLTVIVKDVSIILQMSKNRKIPWLPGWLMCVWGVHLKFLVLLCLYCYFSYTTSFTVFETIGTPYTGDYIFLFRILM